MAADPQNKPANLSCESASRLILHTFCSSAKKFGIVGGLANRNLFSEFRELWCVDPMTPCGDIHQSFTGTLLKWFFDNFPMFADSFSVF